MGRLTHIKSQTLKKHYLFLVILLPNIQVALTFKKLKTIRNANNSVDHKLQPGFNSRCNDAGLVDG
jgi:hypothetical protein